MQIMVVASASAPTLRWQAEVLRRLVAAGHAVLWERVPGAPAWPEAVDLVLDLERLVYRHPGGERPFDRVPPPGAVPPPAAEPPPDRGRPDLVLDLSGSAAGRPDALRLLYEGSPDPGAGVSALLDRRRVRLDVVLGERIVASGHPGNEEPALLSAGLDALLARAADLCCAAVARIAGGAAHGDGAVALPATAAARRCGPGGLRALSFSAQSLAAKARNTLLRRLQRPHAWRVGLRPLGAQSILDSRRLSPAGFGWLRDDGARYYADPFLFAHEGRTWLFVEEYPYATGKGVIAACEVFDDGTFGPTRVVLEEKHHLSYPLVFAQDGAVWMIPESSAGRELVLYRAEAFPGGWRRERVLLAGAALADATPLRHEGRLWIFASETGLSGGSSSDALALFHASGLFGDFAPHPLNPVLVDAGSARPGGRMVRRGGQILRVAQDCRTGYGAGAVLATVDRLDLGGYRQTVVAEFRAPAAWNATGLHAVEVGERFEAIDALMRTVPSGAA